VEAELVELCGLHQAASPAKLHQQPPMEAKVTGLQPPGGQQFHQLETQADRLEVLLHQAARCPELGNGVDIDGKVDQGPGQAGGGQRRDGEVGAGGVTRIQLPWHLRLVPAVDIKEAEVGGAAGDSPGDHLLLHLAHLGTAVTKRQLEGGDGHHLRALGWVKFQLELGVGAEVGGPAGGHALQALVEGAGPPGPTGGWTGWRWHYTYRRVAPVQGGGGGGPAVAPRHPVVGGVTWVQWLLPGQRRDGAAG
jgi:hypothetical protein